MTSPHYTDGPVTIWHGDCLDVMRQLPDASVDAVVTDPPYNLGFMGQAWDRVGSGARGHISDGTLAATPYGRARAEYGGASYGRVGAEDARAFQAWCEDWAREAYRLLKPGGHLLAFGGTRTFHRLTAGIEDAGFEIRDSIAWLYGSGFPKSLDVSKAIDKAAGAEREVVGSKLGQPGYHLSGKGEAGPAYSAALQQVTAEQRLAAAEVTAPATADAARWNGWGTALKPAFEPIVVARKPPAGTVAANVLAYGTGALNIDGSRIGYVSEADRDQTRVPNKSFDGSNNNRHGAIRGTGTFEPAAGRWPANVILDASQAAALDQQSGFSTSPTTTGRGASAKASSMVGTLGAQGTVPAPGDSGGASRFFKTVDTASPRFMYTAKAGSDERPGVDGVSHPTVKPVDLMRWLVKLVTPPGGVVLEPFAGSGTTVEAAVLEGFHCIAIEREADYLPLILQRIRKPHAVGLDLDWYTPTPAPTPIRPAAGRTAPRSPAPAPHPGFDFGDDWELDA